MNEQTPSVGRIVHYYHEGHHHPTAAIITWVWSLGQCPGNAVNLTLFEPTGTVMSSNFGHRFQTPYSPEPKPGHWTWPPRV